MKESHFSLLELNRRIKEILNESFIEKIWFVAEISEFNTNKSGHAYLELIEKSETNGQIIAKARATIWNHTFRMISSYFEIVTNTAFRKNIKILAAASIEFHEIYGFSLNIIDLDPTYTLGDLDKRKQEIVRQLEQDGILNMNKELDFPLVPQRIAIISSSTAAGYGDFTDQLLRNQYGYRFKITLFDSIMQGEQAEKSIIYAFEAIFRQIEKYDLVVVIRGGGSTSDLSCFDSYELACHLAQFPLPVLTGIGHERDNSILDLVAYKELKTPTAVAEYLIAEVLNFDNQISFFHQQIIEHYTNYKKNQFDILHRIEEKIRPFSKNLFLTEKNRISKIQTRLLSQTSLSNSKQKIVLSNLSSNLIHSLRAYFSAKNNALKAMDITLKNNYKRKQSLVANHLEALAQRIQFSDPSNILKKGYTITKHNNKTVRSVNDLTSGDEIVTIFYDGQTKSKL